MNTTLIVLSGLIAGVLNVAAAGGSLISFLALSITGVPPLAANATNLAATPASFLSGIPAAWRHRQTLHSGLASAALGTVAGVWLVTSLSAGTFRRAAPVLLVMAALVLVLQPWLHPRIQRHQGTQHPISRTVWLFCTGIYAGGFGAGVGILVLVVLAYTTTWPWLTVTASKNTICLITSMAGLGTLALTGAVIWPLAALLAAAMAIGGLIGQWLLRRLPEDLLRGAIAVLAAFGAGHMAAT
ncbi:sulfite exporter TauE/SafE family protein [Actinocrispum sp. NPDC049592]|uniref:sulfite exporter TauE/SafE family protein n=1 Tax=Actinocrispum sp. NPDC049592 TaxID=3154835 RepID=UPI00343EC089